MDPSSNPATPEATSKKPKLSQADKIFAVLLVVFVFCDILLSPLGFETRGPAILSNASSLPWFGLLIAGLVLNIVALIVLFFRRRISGIVAVTGSLVYMSVLLADQAGLVIDIKPPRFITYTEVVTFVVLLLVLYYAARVYKEIPTIVATKGVRNS